MEVQSFETIIRALNEAKVQYLIVGGIAVNAHGYERLTKDVDLVIGLKPDNIVKGLRVLKSIGYNMSIPVTPEDFADAAKRDDWRKNKNMIVLKLWSDEHRRTPIDVFVYEPFVFDEEFASAFWFAVTDQLKAPVVRYETLIRMKKETGRPQDLLDAQTLEQIQKWREEDARE
ncbi:MAG: hypothetical protein KF749_17365 [Bacteroidetes bacterium]|nr:hypothetical protein [Bacteroidota bacterium]MCW5896041.1 hypothetical protein [Bacteroidota bacterium]